ncbi:hypothetical protein AMTR_s00009p00048990 [Amborella trichopoda]|uniref:Uncharacterized protein n=1 Tax=Amborella trichopoda TaxID=13333 RepID=W1NI19_AMBTC|nr:hypothetical protein AMTR_s00009p00048990 [Amborella trichopoda]
MERLEERVGHERVGQMSEKEKEEEEEEEEREIVLVVKGPSYRKEYFERLIGPPLSKKQKELILFHSGVFICHQGNQMAPKPYSLSLNATVDTLSNQRTLPSHARAAHPYLPPSPSM